MQYLDRTNYVYNSELIHSINSIGVEFSKKGEWIIFFSENILYQTLVVMFMSINKEWLTFLIIIFFFNTSSVLNKILNNWKMSISACSMKWGFPLNVQLLKDDYWNMQYKRRKKTTIFLIDCFSHDYWQLFYEY